MEQKMTSATSAPPVSKPCFQGAPRSPACTCGASIADGLNPAKRSAKRAFTLVELLVVIGIIVILIGILLPMVVKAMKQANRMRIASDLNAISASLNAYKADFGDYPRIIYQPVPPNYNGTGSGAAVLGKALLGLGDSVTNPFSATVPYVAGQIVSYSSIEYQAMQAVPLGNTPAEGSAYWAPIPLITAADGANGPGFSIRAGQGHVYGPYLPPDKFKTRGLAILDSFGNPILYYAANPAHPTITVQGAAANYGSKSSVGGVSNSYVGTAPGVTPGLAPATPTAPCQSLYNYSDNDTVALNAANGSTTDFIPAFPDICVMQAMLGDYNMNGYIDSTATTTETAATTAPFLLWSAGPDGVYGPLAPSAVTYFQSLPPAAIQKLVIKCDDVTNFNVGQ
jgi:prepilin-type N-terminal cleavage/methylation domain-containing protein